ncbi:nucleoside phosphorylase domain-containing protein [Flagelloscypha sp. PMI_526]|nr:nucleoside phosphorylase domain-containing protein [Flagelloscypha sp. PMI_526]
MSEPLLHPDLLNKAVKAVEGAIPVGLHHPRVGIVCGSGLGGMVDLLQELVLVSYDDIPGFSKSTVQGHKSALAFGYVGDKKVPVVAMLGRFHLYEGYKPASVIYPIRLMAKMGIQEIIIVAVHDHLSLPNLTGANALLGPVFSPEHPRFVPLSDAYSLSLRRLLFLAAHKLGLSEDAVEEGTYACVSGPTYETPAEGRFLRNAGADLVGMSTVPEVLAAKEAGNIRILVLSLVTNPVVIPEGYRSIKQEVAAELAGQKIEHAAIQTVNHEEVLEVGKSKANVMQGLVQAVIEMVVDEP